MSDRAEIHSTVWWRSARAALVAVLVLHVLFVTRQLPLDVAFGADPILRTDYSLHWYHASVHATSFGGPLASWGYDPFHMAGWVGGTISTLDDKALIAWTWLFGEALGAGRAFNLFFLVAFSLVPLAGYTAMRILERPRAEGVAAAAAFAVAWNLDLEVVTWSLFGTYAFLLATAVAMPITASLSRAIRVPGWRNAALLAATAPLFYLHALTPLMCAILGLALVVPLVRAKQRALPAATAVLVIAVANLPWTLPMLADLHLLEPLPRPGRLVHGGGGGLSELARQFALPTPRFFGVIVPLVVAPFGLVRLARTGHRHVAVAWGLGGIVVFLTAFLGGYSEVISKFVEANRMRPAFALVAAVPTGLGAVELFERWRGWMPRTRVVTAVVTALVLALGAFVPVKTRLFGKARLWSQVPERATLLFDALTVLGDPAGRVAFEETGPRPPAGIGLWAGAIGAGQTGRAWLGGPYYRGWVPHSDASFSFGRFGLRPLVDLSDAEIAAFLDLYDVTGLAAIGGESIARLRAATGVVEEAGVSAPYVLFRARRKPSPFLTGSGTVVAKHDTIAVRPDGPGDVVLKLHWDRRLRVDPPLTLVREAHPRDRIGFIRVNGGDGSPFTIRLR